jgi:hypothetical protein
MILHCGGRLYVRGERRVDGRGESERPLRVTEPQRLLRTGILDPAFSLLCSETVRGAYDGSLTWASVDASWRDTSDATGRNGVGGGVDTAVIGLGAPVMIDLASARARTARISSLSSCSSASIVSSVSSESPPGSLRSRASAAWARAARTPALTVRDLGSFGEDDVGLFRDAVFTLTAGEVVVEAPERSSHRPRPILFGEERVRSGSK